MINKLFKQMTYVQIISVVTPTLCRIIDSIVVGRLIGVDAMSAYGISAPLIIVLSAIGLMMVNGIEVIIGKSMGRGDMDSANVCFSTSIVVSLCISAACILLLFAIPDRICTVLGAGTASLSNPIFVHTRGYLYGYFLGTPFLLLSLLMGTYLQSLGKRRILIVSVIAMTISDIALDLISVFVFDAGMFGIGLATSLSYLVSVIVYIFSFLEKDCAFRFSMRKVQLSYMTSIAKAGSPVLYDEIFYTTKTFLFNWILIWIGGNTAVAVFAVFTVLDNLIYSIGLGAGAVTLLLSSLFYNDEDRESLQVLVKVMITHSLMILVSVILIAELLSFPLIRLFIGPDPVMLPMAVGAFRIFLIGLVATNLTDVFKNYFQGIGRMFLTNLVGFLKNLGIMIPCVLLFSHLFRFTGFWIGTVVGQYCSLLAIAVIVWTKYGRVSFSSDAFSYLGQDFGAKPGDYMEMTVENVEDAVKVSKELNEFCKGKGMDNRTGMLIGLCAEEMIVNIIEHGFNKDRNSDNVDVRMTVHDDRRVIRIRDNCKSFDPTKYLELHQNRESDPSAHIGIRMVMSLVKEANYINTLGLNNLTLVL